MIEKEIKAIITEEQYKAISTLYPWGSTKPQINHYYTDENGELKKQGITFRIRTIDEKHIVQVKKHLNRESVLQISEEKEFPIDSLPDSFSSDEIKGMTDLAVAVNHIGDLTTLRSSYSYCEGVEICLDKNSFLDRVDYEIEIEYTSSIPDSLLNELLQIGVSFDKKASGKYSRFVTRLKEILKSK